jgi:large subunit ribosomal protein L6
MSRIGKKPVVIPAGVTAKVDGQLVQVGAKASWSSWPTTFPSSAGQRHLDEPRNETSAPARCGATRAQIGSIVVGVTTGEGSVTGVGYRAGAGNAQLALAIRMT